MKTFSFPSATLVAVLLWIGACSSKNDQADVIRSSNNSLVAGNSTTAAAISPFLTSGDADLEQAHQLIQSGQIGEAQRLILNASRSSNGLVDAESRCTQAEIAIRLGDLERSEGLVVDCLSFAREIPENVAIQAYSHHLSGFLSHIKGEYPEALKHYERAISLESLLTEDRKAALLNTLNNLGNVKYRLGDFESAKNIHSEVLEGRIKIYGANHPKVAGSLGNLGNAFHSSGQASAAIGYHQAALSIWQQTVSSSSLQLAYTLDNIGVSLISAGKFQAAISSLSAALEIKRQNQAEATSSVATSHLNLADAHLGLGQIVIAGTHIRQAINTFESLSIQSLPKYTLALNILAEVYSAEGEHELGLKIVEDELSRIGQAPNPASYRLLTTKSKLCYKLNLYQCAIESSINAIDLNAGISGAGSAESIVVLSNSANSKVLLESLKAKSNALLKLAETEHSKDKLLRAFDSLETLIALSNSLNLGVITGRFSHNPYNTLEAELEQFLHIGLQLLDANDDVHLKRRLLLAADLYLGGSLVAALRKEEAHNEFSGFDPLPFNDLRSSNLEEPVYPQGHLEYALGSRTQYLANDLVMMNSLALPTLSDGLSVVKYLSVKGNLIAFIITANRLDLVHLGQIDGVEEASEKLQLSLRTGEHQSFIHLAHSLHSRLIDPILPSIGSNDLLIIPHYPVNGIPFELLIDVEDPADPELDDAGRLPYLISERRISYGYSVAQIVLGADHDPQPFEKEFLGLAPVFDADQSYSEDVSRFLRKHLRLDKKDRPVLAPLPGSERELNDISDILSSTSSGFKRLTGSNSDLKFRDQVSESALKNMDLSKYRYLHIATHGFADRETPSESGVVLQTSSKDMEDGILFASEVASMRIGAELVVLSSCDSALDKGPGTEIAGLAKSFLFAGSKNVVASLWPSDDVAAQLLMRLLYVHMSEGMPVDQALRQAKLDLLEMGGPIANPYYWAGFIHIGAPSGLQRPAA